METRSQISAALSAIIESYTAKDPERFMAFVSEDFTGGALALDSAIRQDFSLLDNIDLRVSVSNMAVSPSGYVHVVLTYSRSVVSTRSGSPLDDSGMTEIVFEYSDGDPKIYALKNPLLFGVSRAGTIATGTIVAERNTRTLVVTEEGSASIMPLGEAYKDNGSN